MDVKFYTSMTIQKGKNLRSMEAVKARLTQIAANKKSKYNKHLREGRIQVHFIHQAYTPMWDIVVITEHDPEGLSSCGSCGAQYLDLTSDYLCSECRDLALTG